MKNKKLDTTKFLCRVMKALTLNVLNNSFVCSSPQLNVKHDLCKFSRQEGVLITFNCFYDPFVLYVVVFYIIVSIMKMPFIYKSQKVKKKIPVLTLSNC